MKQKCCAKSVLAYLHASRWTYKLCSERLKRNWSGLHLAVDKETKEDFVRENYAWGNPLKTWENVFFTVHNFYTSWCESYENMPKSHLTPEPKEQFCIKRNWRKLSPFSGSLTKHQILHYCNEPEFYFFPEFSIIRKIFWIYFILYYFVLLKLFKYIINSIFY